MTSPLIVRVLDDPDEVTEARRLHARRYLEAGFVDRLDRGDVIDDAYVECSDYFAVADDTGRIVGVSRLIPSNLHGLPAIDEFDVDPDGRRRFDAIAPGRVAEVSALAVERGFGAFSGGEVSKALYRAMYQFSLLDADYTHWVAAIDVRVARHLVRSHGFLFDEIGPSRLYLGSETIPVLLDLYAQMRHYALVDTRGGGFFSAGLIVDLRGNEARLVGSTGEFVPLRGQLLR